MEKKKERLAVATQAAKLVENIEKVVLGKREVIRRTVAALLAEGHILLEDIPGVGKTVLAKALARSIAGEFKRIQFTADLLPSDVTGVNIYDAHNGVFRFRPGPLFCNVLLGDEINRATPRTQSSLLEAMEESQTTVDGERHSMRRPFFVIATQNPIELEGTYPLPFAQMDRFMVRLQLGYLAETDEVKMLRDRLLDSPLDDLEPVIDSETLLAMQQTVRQISVTPELMAYVVAVVRQSRDFPEVEFGASPRASLDLLRCAQAFALLHGRDHLLPDDVKEAAPPVLAHRLIVSRGARRVTVSGEAVIAEILAKVDVPL